MAGPALLVLVRHAAPLVDPARPSTKWPLSDEGVAAARRLAVRLAPLRLDRVVSSVEDKARQTGLAVADGLGVPFQTAHDLHEHERPFEPDPATFLDRMQALFAAPAAHQPVERRFSQALDAVVRAHRGERLAVVTHGTVLALHLAARYGADGWSLWQRLEMPSYAVVELRTKTVVDLVTSV